VRIKGFHARCYGSGHAEVPGDVCRETGFTNHQACDRLLTLDGALLLRAGQALMEQWRAHRRAGD
jgi:hypothetical protein